MAEGSIAEWLDGAEGDGADDEQRMWRPDADHADREERSRRLWRLAGAVWGVLVLAGAVLLVAGRLMGAAPAEEGATDHPHPASPEAEPGPPPAGGLEPASAPTGGVEAGSAPAGGVEASAAPAGAGPVAADGDALGALAAVAVRLAATTDGEPARYVDLVEPERIERHGDVAVVTVAAVVLEGREGRWETVRPARYGVALRDGEKGTVVLGGPWPLPPPEPTAPSPVAADGVAEDVEDPALAEEVTAALAGAGWGEPTAIALLAGAEEPWLQARVTALAPGEAEPRSHDVWFHRGESLRLAGTPR